MEHIKYIRRNGVELPETFFTKATGQYYTHSAVASHLNTALLSRLGGQYSEGERLFICDPFCGDGRLVKWLLQAWSEHTLPRVSWRIALWDIDGAALSAAKQEVLGLLHDLNMDGVIECTCEDAFKVGFQNKNQFDLVITNPPWELLKPDARELRSMPTTVRDAYIQTMRDYDCQLAIKLPDSQPLRKFAGWGTNLSRVGLELCQLICRAKGLLAIVMPSSFIADNQSIKLRRLFLLRHTLLDVAFFPAEARLFNGADTPVITMLVRIDSQNEIKPIVTIYDKKLAVACHKVIQISQSFLEKSGYILPVSFGIEALDLLHEMVTSHTNWHDLEGKGSGDLWAGRELDETRIVKCLKEGPDGLLFIKGKDIDRYSTREILDRRVHKPGWIPPESTNHERIVWRDVSRQNQKRRVIATIIPAETIAGNSLGVAYFRDDDRRALLAMLGIINSFCFEFILRSHLATGHVSLSSLRKVSVPSRELLDSFGNLADAVQRVMEGDAAAQTSVEAIVAKEVYDLTKEELSLVLSLFVKVPEEELDAVLENYSRRYCP